VYYKQNCAKSAQFVTFIVEEEASLRGAGLGGDKVDVGSARLDTDDLFAGSATLAEVGCRRLRRRHFQVVVTETCRRRRA